MVPMPFTSIAWVCQFNLSTCHFTSPSALSSNCSNCIAGVNAMTLAAFSGNLDIIAMLLNYSSLENYCKTTFIPPLCAATIAGHDRVVHWFCDTFRNPKPEQLPKTIEGLSVTPFVHRLFVVIKVFYLNRCHTSDDGRYL